MLKLSRRLDSRWQNKKLLIDKAWRSFSHVNAVNGRQTSHQWRFEMMEYRDNRMSIDEVSG